MTGRIARGRTRRPTTARRTPTGHPCLRERWTNDEVRITLDGRFHRHKSKYKRSCDFFTDSVRHGLLLEIHVLVVGVEPRSFVREEFRAQAEEEAVVGAVELRAELPRARGEAAEFMAGLLENVK